MSMRLIGSVLITALVVGGCATSQGPQEQAGIVIGEEREEVVGGWIEPHFETIDGSVFEKYRADAKYCPPNLTDWARRAELRIEDLAETRATA